MTITVSMRRTLGAAAVAAALVAGSHVAQAQAPVDASTVKTDRGPVHGTIAGNVRVFTGIPYAAPPVGALRFAPPQQRAAWTTAFDATKPGDICPQNAPNLPPMSEDCLNLNVTTPYPVAGKVPVMIWIHGGGDQVGSGMFFDASRLVATGNIVVVTINYRQGILGWLTATALDTGSHRIGNYGHEDIIAATAWVQRNIANFGGDPKDLTLAGESGGAMHVCDVLASPGSLGIYRRGIVESGPCARSWPTVDEQVQKMQPMVAQLGCSGSDAQIATCLRGVPLDKVLSVQAAFPGHPFSASIGGADIPEQPRSKLGNFPLLMGGNTLELGAYITPPTNAADYSAALVKTYAANAAAVEAKYPYASYPDGYTALATAETDFNAPLDAVVYCWDVRTLQLQAATRGAPIWGYEFDDPNAPISLRRAGPVHGAELQYLFPLYTMTVPYPGPNPPLPGASRLLSDTMIRYWTNFVWNGDPNGPGVPQWAPYHQATDVMMLRPGPNGVAAGVDVVDRHKCKFWNGLGFAN